MPDETGAAGQPYGAESKVGSAGGAVVGGQFNHKIGSGRQGHTGSGPFVGDGRFAALGIIPAHDAYNVGVAGETAGSFDMV